jgi:Fe/S biogenesis protein NfuA
MITFTEAAQQKVAGILSAKGQDGFAVRIRITGKGTDEFIYQFRSVEAATRRGDDIVVDLGEFEVYIDPESAVNLEGAVVDFSGLGGGSFKIDNPNPVWTDETARQVAEIIGKQINPGVATHGGEIVLVDVKDDVVYVRMTGGCQGCGLAGVTLRQGIEKQLREQVPTIKEVVDVTHHDQGVNPFYAPGEAGESPVPR